ncbi:MAG TPA: YtxH domain-containing protein [Vicinamibacterales bacterium]|nr:YtxH domain-containing protein [Vicinamibacterales bacterium]
MYREEPSGASFMLGILTGAFVGAGIALLFAPKPGTEIRAQLGERYRGLADRVGEQTESLRATAGQLRDQGRERIQQMSSQLSDRVSSTGERVTQTSEAERFPSSAPSI